MLYLGLYLHSEYLGSVPSYPLVKSSVKKVERGEGDQLGDSRNGESKNYEGG